MPKRKFAEKFLSDIPKPEEVDSGLESFYAAARLEPRDSQRDLKKIPGPPHLFAQADVPTATLPLEHVVPDPQQPRKTFDPAALDELADSIREYGLLQPVVVRPADDDRYIIVAGERRWRACKLAGKTSVDAKILRIDAMRAFEIALAENVQRDSLLPLEEAAAYGRLMEERSLRQADVARLVGVDRRRVSDKLALLRLPPDVQALVSGRQDNLSEGHALVLVTAPADLDILHLARRCIEDGWSVQRLRSAVAEQQTGRETPKLFQNVRMNVNRRGGFTLMVRARSRDEVETTLAELRGTIATLEQSFLQVSGRQDNMASIASRERGEAS